MRTQLPRKSEMRRAVVLRCERSMVVCSVSLFALEVLDQNNCRHSTADLLPHKTTLKSNGNRNPRVLSSEIPEIDNGDGSFFALKVEETSVKIGRQTCIEIKWEPENRVIIGQV